MSIRTFEVIVHAEDWVLLCSPRLATSRPLKLTEDVLASSGMVLIRMRCMACFVCCRT